MNLQRQQDKTQALLRSGGLLVFGKIKQNTPNLHLGIPQDTQPKTIPWRITRRSWGRGGWGPWSRRPRHVRELKQQRWRRIRKRHLKVDLHCFKLYRAYSISFDSSNVGNFFLEMNSKRLYRSSGKKKESRFLVFTPSKKREIRKFHAVVVQWRQ